MIDSSPWPPWSDLRFDDQERDALVVGGGIIGSTVAAVLAESGWQVTLAQAQFTHAQHLAAALTPVISRHDNARVRLARLATKRASDYWRRLGDAVASPCGAIQLERAPDDRRFLDLHAQVQAFNQPEWAHWLDQDQASEKAGLALPRGGIWYPHGWLVRVPRLLAALQATPGVRSIQTEVNRLDQTLTHWEARDGQGQTVAQARLVVLANAFDVPALLSRSQLDASLAACRRLSNLHRVAGEITFLPQQSVAWGPRCVVAGDGYVLPAVDGWCVSGGTYAHGVDRAQCTPEGRLANVHRAKRLLGTQNLPSESDVDSLSGWAGWRAVLPGRLPVIAPVPGVRHLWAFTAAASRGLTWSVLGAELIRDALAGKPPELPSELLVEIAA